jgi:lipid-A-disaccharide synthase
MVNLIAERQVVPELVQQDFTTEGVVAEMRSILPDGAARDAMLEGFTGVKSRLHSTDRGIDGLHPAQRAAEAILGVLKGAKRG